MSLRKSDKIIAAVGVVILILAVFAIIYYFDGEDTVDDAGDSDELGEYKVTWESDSDEFKITGEAYPDYNKPIKIDVEEGCVIQKVKVQLTWEDDSYVVLSLFRKGFDTLTADFNLGSSSGSCEHTGDGNESFDLLAYDPLLVEMLEDKEDKFAAEESLYDLYEGMNEVTIDTNITITPGEKFFFRPIPLIKKLTDSGDDFELIVAYDFVKPTVEGEEPNDDGNNDDGNGTDGYNGAYGGYFRDTSRGRDI